ncbi:MAG: hypothetical protein J3Q66DRAFT_431590 [Benniella sp.]|nr:MAG: hypothetical protein J3Q66DRAFT_431590 [Benniella sp.]
MNFLCGRRDNVSVQPETKGPCAQASASESEPTIHVGLKRIPPHDPFSSQTSHDNDLEFSSKSEELLPGYYSVTWCMAPMNNNQLFDLVFEIETCSTECKLWAKTSKEEIASISPKDPSNGLRLRLQRKLHLEHSSKIVVRLSVRLRSSPDASSGQGSELGAYSVELVRLGTEAPGEDFDYEVKAPGKMLLQLDNKTFGQMAPIFATDVSASGEYIAILSADLDNAYVHILDINDALQRSASSSIRASYTITLERGQFHNMQLVKIAISSDGAYFALYQKPCGDDLSGGRTEPESFRFPFHAFQLNFVSPKERQKASDTMRLVEDPAIQQLKEHFIGYGMFLDRGRSKSGNEDFREHNSNEHGDYFVAINESRINVYDVDNHWKPLFGHNIGDLGSMGSRMKQLRMLHQSISGSQFVWMEDGQNVSVWDLESGANVKYISVNNPYTSQEQQDEISHLAVSPGGKLLALSGKDWIRTYFLDSCIEICKVTIDDDVGTVMNIEFIDQDKSLLVMIGKPSMEQTSVIMDAMNLPSWPSHKREFPSCYTNFHVALPPNGPGKDGAMMVLNWNMLEMYEIPLIASGGTQLVGCQGKCTVNPRQELSYNNYRLVMDFEKRNNRNRNRQHKLARVCLWVMDNQGSWRPIMTIIPEPWKFLDMSEMDNPVKASFLSPRLQFIIITSSGFQVWNLPQSDSDNQCELALSWVKPHWGDTEINGGVESSVERIQETVVCSNGECAKSTWIDSRNRETEEHVSIPKSSWSTQSDTIHCINSFPVLASCYAEPVLDSSYFDSSAAARGAIIRYIIKNINYDPSGGAIEDSMMDMIAMSAKWKCCSDILSAILRSTDGKWIPRCTSTVRVNDGHQSANPISLLLKNAKKDPYALSMAQELMDYCTREAKSQCDPAFLHPVSACLPEMIDHHPDIAIDVTRRSSFIPVRNKHYVADRAIVAPPLLTMALDWVMGNKRAIYEYQDPVFQLKSQLFAIIPGDFSTHIEVARERIPDMVINERFKERVYVAPYSLLWHYRDNTATPNHADGIIAWIQAVICWIINRIVDLALYIINRIMAMASTKSNFICTVVTMGCHGAAMVVDIVNPLHKPTLRLNFRSRRYHDSPAIAALIRYKWDSVAWMAWMIRMAFQSLFLTSIILITGNQIYPVIKIWYLIAPILFAMALGALGLYLEVLEFFEDYKLYFSSPYNIVDVIGYLLPISGFMQLLNSIIKYDNTNVIGDSRLLSIGVAITYFQIIYELRVFRDVCNITTNIWNMAWELRFFGVIFVFITTSWTHTILHMLRGRSNDCFIVGENGDTISDRWECPTRSAEFPYDPLAAYIATFFIMNGNFDPVSEYMRSSGDLTFLCMMGIYYVILVIVLLNLLIAFMNVSTMRVEGEGTLAWFNNHYLHVGKAENLSFAAPGFRQRFDLFPQYLYYTVSQKRAEEFGESKDSQGKG